VQRGAKIFLKKKSAAAAKKDIIFLHDTPEEHSARQGV
jgi:hypothetical protein